MPKFTSLPIRAASRKTLRFALASILGGCYSPNDPMPEKGSAQPRVTRNARVGCCRRPVPLHRLCQRAGSACATARQSRRHYRRVGQGESARVGDFMVENSAAPLPSAAYLGLTVEVTPTYRLTQQIDRYGSPEFTLEFVGSGCWRVKQRTFPRWHFAFAPPQTLPIHSVIAAMSWA